MKKEYLPNRSFLTNFAMQTMSLILLFVSNIFPQVIISERVEINPIEQTLEKRTTEGDGWWIDTCYIDTYDSSEVDLTFTPSAIEPGETTIMTLDYNEELHNKLERNIILEPNIGTLVWNDTSEYKYYAPSSTPGDTALVVRIHYEQFQWACADGTLRQDSTEAKYLSDDLQCGCPLFTWPRVSRKYGIDSIMIAWDSLDVKVEPDTIYPGDTAQVVIKKRLPNGTLIDFDSTQTYEVGMLDGCILGKLVAGAQEGPYVVDVLQPIYFIADTSADTTGSVLLRAGLVESTDKSKNKNNEQTDLVESDCFIGGQFGSYDDVTVVKGDPLEIIYPTINDPDEKITSDPQMPEVICKAWLKNNIGEPVTFEWEYEVSYSYNRRTASGGYVCSRTSKSTFRGTTYGTGGFMEEWTVPFSADENNSFEFKGQNWDGGCGEIITEWIEGYDVFTGGNVKITVTAKATGSELMLGKKTQEANRVLGDNPSPEVISNYANSNQMKAIIWKESKFNQFTDYDIAYRYWWPYNEIGWPIYGPPGGYGLSQIDNYPTPTEKMLWHWKANVDAGKQRLQTAKDEVERYRRQMGVSNEEKYILTNVFQNYKGGYFAKYYVWDKSEGWVRSNLKSEYGDEVYDQYLLYGGGN